MQKIVDTVTRFVRETVWLERRGVKGAWGFLWRLLRLCIMVGRGFYDDKCFLRASGLAFTTLLSLVPVLAFSFSILKGFGAEEIARDRLVDYLTLEREDIGERIEGYVDNVANYVGGTRVTALGALSLAFLLWTAIKVLSTVENSFNDIWGLARGRTLVRKVADYTSVLVITPVLIATAISVSAYLSANPLSGGGVTVTAGRVLLRVAARLGPYLLLWAAFAAFYAFMPNTRVKFSAALVGGLVGASLWQAAFWGYATFQIGVSKYNAIYGGFAALPIFLGWLYLSWVITLFGAEVTFAYEHSETYRQHMERYNPSPAARERLALRTFLEIARAFREGRAAPDADSLAEAAGVPVRAVNDVVGVLGETELVSSISAGRDIAYQPGRDISQITAADVLAAVRNHGDAFTIPAKDPLWRTARGLSGDLDGALTDTLLTESIAQILESDEGGSA
ncbi:MAG: YihY/virulence factor BrkB family protein [Planctomycetota bacterium]|jgi:membrane protein